MVVKGKFYDAIVANTLEQAQKAFYEIQAKWGLPIIVQEFITGTEINIAAMGDVEGKAAHHMLLEMKSSSVPSSPSISSIAARAGSTGRSGRGPGD